MSMLSNADALLVAIPMIGIIMIGFFRLDELVGEPKNRRFRVISFQAWMRVAASFVLIRAERRSKSCRGHAEGDEQTAWFLTAFWAEWASRCDERDLLDYLRGHLTRKLDRLIIPSR